MIKGIRLTAFFGLALAASLVMFIAAQDTRAAINFEPGVVFCFENVDTPAECDGDPAPGANTDIRNRFCIGWNNDCTVKDASVNDSNFGAVVAFTPVDLFPTGAALPVGALAGRLTAQSTLGLLNGNCGSAIDVAFSMMNGSIDLNNLIEPKPPGEANVFEPLALDADGNGIPDGADKYPEYLKEFFDNIQPRARLFGISKIQGNWIVLNFVFFEPGVTLEAAQTTVTLKPEFGVPSVTILGDPTAPAAAGAITDFCAPLLSQNIALGQSKDNPCTGGNTGAANCPSETAIFSNRGYPLFPCETGNANDEDADGKVNDGCPQSNAVPETGAECDDNLSNDPEDSDINDGCPQFGDLSEGARIGGTCSGTNEGGCPGRINPAAGTYTFNLLTASQRDADGDGIENSLDVCFKDPNPSWNPRGPDPVNDPDNDGLPKPCDPNDAAPGAGSPQTCKAGFVGFDEDQDCFANRQDNCPLQNQLTDPAAAPSNDNLPIPEDGDSDGIGDLCDPNPDVVNGEPVVMCLSVNIEVGAGASTAPQQPNFDRSGLSCAAAVVSAGPTPVPPIGGGPNATTAPGTTPRPGTGGGGGGGGGVQGGNVTTGIGSLAPTNSNLPLWAAALAIVGGLGLVAGVGLLSSQRARKRPDSE